MSLRFLTLLLLCVSLLSAAPFTILTEDNPPYNYEKRGIVKGYCTAVVNAIQEIIDPESITPVQIRPWNQAYERTLNRADTMLYSTVRLKTREKLFHWVGPIAYNDNYLFERANKPTGIRQLEDAKKVRHISAGPRNSADYFMLKSMGFTNLLEDTEISNTFTHLMDKRVNLAISDPLTAPFKLKALGYKKYDAINTSVRVYAEPLFMAFSRETDPKTIEAWQLALHQLMGSGAYDTIKRKSLKEAYADYGIHE